MQKTTLLLDLDDTLLNTNLEAFVPAYFQALASALVEDVPPEKMLPALTVGTKAMMDNQDPGRTLREVFNSHFFPQLGINQEALTGKIDHFYDEIFPSLGYVAAQRPEAIRFVKWAFENDFLLGIATNPYFPIKAVKHRMIWAGLPAEEYPFAGRQEQLGQTRDRGNAARGGVRKCRRHVGDGLGRRGYRRLGEGDRGAGGKS